MNRIKLFVLAIAALACPASVMAAHETQTDSTEAKDKIDVNEIIGHHIADAHSWNIFGYTNSDGEKVELTIPLPVITYYKEGDVLVRLSSAFEEEAVVEHNGLYYKMHHGKIYITNAAGDIETDENGPTNERPLDISITRNVVSMFMSVALLLLIFIGAARAYRKSSVPRGGNAMVETLVLFVKDIADEHIGKEKSDKFAPYILTLFFFIWINNIIGLIPFFPGGSNLSGNISFTGILAVFTFLTTAIFASKSYWKHNLTAPGIPFPMKFLLVPIEIVSMFTKPFTLLIRLFANVTGGHIIILSLVSMIFITQSYVMTIPSVLLSLVIFVLELIFGALQAYIFALLSSLYIGLAVKDEEHED